MKPNESRPAREEGNEPSVVPVDADALRQGLAGMRDTLAGVQLELENARRQLDEAAEREAELEVALLELRPTAPRSSGGRLRRWSRRMRRLFARGIVRVTPRALVPFIWHNPLFNSTWYLERNPDVRERRTGLERHYRRHGVSEGRDPNAFFGTSWYLARYPDVAASGINPLDHYHLYGALEGRDPSRWFHTRWYLAQNPDVAAVGSDPLLHYVRHGASEGRALRPGRAIATGLAVRPEAAVPAAPERSRPALPHQRGPWEPRASLLDSVPRNRPIVLMLDDAFPRADRDAGSVLVQQYVGLFEQLGYHVHFVALRDDGRSPRHRKALAATGATVVDIKADHEGVIDLLERDGARIDVAFLSRVSVAGPHIEEVARHCPSARIIFNTQDLHFLREERAAQLARDRIGMYKAARLRELEDPRGPHGRRDDRRVQCREGDSRSRRARRSRVLVPADPGRSGKVEWVHGPIRHRVRGRIPPPAERGRGPLLPGRGVAVDPRGSSWRELLRSRSGHAGRDP